MVAEKQKVLELEGKMLRRFNQQIGPLGVLLRRTVNTHNSKLQRPWFNYQILSGVRCKEPGCKLLGSS